MYIKQQFPHFNLEDKVAKMEGGIDRGIKVYVRRNKGGKERMSVRN